MKTEGVIKDKPSEIKMVLLILEPEGSAQVKTFTRSSPLPKGFVLRDSELVSEKNFASMPKRMAFFFEKGFGALNSKD